MTIALLLIPYGVGLIVYGVFSAFALTNLIAFGTKNFTTFLITFLYSALSIVVLFFWYIVLTNVTWSTPILENGFIFSP